MMDTTYSTATDMPEAKLNLDALAQAMKTARRPASIQKIYFRKEYLTELQKLATVPCEGGINEFMGVPFFESGYLPKGVDAMMVNENGDIVLVTNEEYPHKKTTQK